MDTGLSSALLILADGRLPAGGHAYSAGVESAVRFGDVVDGASLERYLAGRLATTGVTDAAFAARTCASATLADELATLDVEYDARLIAPRQRETSRRLGRQLMRTVSAIWSHPHLDALAATAGGPHQAIALGGAVRAAGGGPRDAATISIHHLAAAGANAAIRLLGLDPIAAAAVQERCTRAAAELLADAWSQLAPCDLPACTSSLAELLAEEHGTWDDRMFAA